MDIKVTVGNTTKRKDLIIDSSKSPIDALKLEQIDYSSAQICLNGTPLTAGETASSFADLGITTECMVIANIKTVNA